MGNFKWTLGGVVLGLVAGCGNDTGTTASASNGETESGSESQGTTQGSGNPTGSSMTEGSASQGSMSESNSGTTSTTGPTTGPTTGMSMSGPTSESESQSGTSGTASAGTTSEGNTTGEVCPAQLDCGEVCCAEGQVCLEGQCQKDCGGAPPCGPQEECCAEAELCLLGQCLQPAGPCMQATCATIDQGDCPEGFVCDEHIMMCVPSLADKSCKYIPPNATFEPKPQFTWGTRKKFACQQDSQCQKAEVCMAGSCTPTWPHINIAANDMPMHNQSSSIPLVVDLDRDCVPEIVFNSYRPGVITSDGVLRAIRGDTGAKVWSVVDPAWRTDGTANPAVGDLDGDSNPEIVVQGAGKFLLAFDQSGKPLWKSDPFNMSTVSGSAAIVNIDNDGPAEVVFGSAVFSSTGKKLYEGIGGVGLNGQGPISCVADLDGDGRQEVIAGKIAHSFSGTIDKNDFAGKVLWTSAQTDGFCGVADFNGDKKPEVILVSKANIYALNGQTGQTIATAPIPAGGNGGPPNIADFDGDKVPDVAAAGSTQYIVYKFNGQAFTKLWSATIDDTSSQVTGSSVFDFDGDGRNEVVYNDEVYIRIYPGVEPDCLKNPKGPACDGIMTDAEVLFRDKNGSRTRTEYPVIADVDGDFKAEIVFSTNNDHANAVDAGIEVWGDALDNWVSTRPVWNQHSYHITNVGLLGEIPVMENNNWTTPMDNPYNSYRNNVQGASDFCAPDLVPYDLDFDAALCADELSLSVWVANQGCLGVGPGVNVAFYEQQMGLLGVVQTKGPLVAGAAEQVKLSIPGNYQAVSVYAVADDDGMGMGKLNECVEDNNSSPVDQLCIPPG